MSELVKYYWWAYVRVICPRDFRKKDIGDLVCIDTDSEKLEKLIRHDFPGIYMKEGCHVTGEEFRFYDRDEKGNERLVAYLWEVPTLDSEIRHRNGMLRFKHHCPVLNSLPKEWRNQEPADPIPEVNDG